MGASYLAGTLTAIDGLQSEQAKQRQTAYQKSQLLETGAYGPLLNEINITECSGLGQEAMKSPNREAGSTSRGLGPPLGLLHQDVSRTQKTCRRWVEEQ